MRMVEVSFSMKGIVMLAMQKNFTCQDYLLKLPQALYILRLYF